MRRDHAETVAARALDWIVGRDGLFHKFLNSTGTDLVHVRAKVNDPDFLAAVLDFLAQDDRRVREFCEAEGLPLDSVLQARAALPGGDEMHWT
ncbi:uncharacterized protein DUF3572 [Palleronia aestuarii]|uniref:Uncharacterized protein DUF3572 n=1 Tax=Palleronia aestuarii TaxID=568105 RepID=A0A2W7NE10_9RHOB|nr:DUF3572 domain-containing protein [Palleronia aestuarii]PZX16337.1 uncharacterized protein DUF3572 [Palleronia aestuarii]